MATESRSRPIRGDRTTAVVAFVLGASSGLFLTFFRAIELSSNSTHYVFDALSATPDQLFYAPHLGYSTSVYLFSLVLGAIGDCSVECAGRFHSIVWAVVGVVCMYLLLHRLTKSHAIGLLAATSLLVSNGFWVFASQVEVYVPLAGALLLLATLLVLGGDGWSRTSYVLACAAVWTVATLFHQATAVFAVPLAIYLGAEHGRRGWTQAALICLAAGTAVLLAYLGAYVTLDSGQPFLAWLVGLANTDLTDWGLVSNWRFDGLKRAMYSQVTSLIVLPDAVRTQQLPVQWRGSLLILAVLGWNLFYVLKRRAGFALRAFFLAWFFTYFLFFAWWDPRVLKFYIPSGVALIGLGAIALHDIVRSGTRLLESRGYPAWPFEAAVGAGLILALGATFAFNLVGSILPIRGNLGPALGPHYGEARTLHELTPDGCWTIAFGHQLVYQSYYFDETTRERRQSIRALYQAYYDDRLDPAAPGEESERRRSVDAPCAVVNLAYVSERFFERRTRPEVRVDSPVRQPPDWHDFLDWFFRVEPIEGTDMVTFDAFRLVLGDNGRAYLLVDHREREQGPRDYVADELTTYVDEYGYKPTTVFPGRDRTLIFGYSGNANSAEPQGLLATLREFVANSERGSVERVD